VLTLCAGLWGEDVAAVDAKAARKAARDAKKAAKTVAVPPF
jgi:hypothetical protein